MLDRQHLSILREVHRTGSVTAAAEQLNLSQSALSHTIAKLESRCGVAIWIKQGRNLRLTQAGQYLLDVAERVVPELAHAERVLAEFARGRRGNLRVGMECHPCQRWLMRVTAPYLVNWPQVDLQVRTAFRFDGVAALQAHEIDVLVTPDPLNLPDLIFAPVFGYELKIIVPLSHPLADQDFVLPEDLAKADLITIPVSIDRLDLFTRFMIPAHCKPRSHRTAETTELILQLVAAGRGISVLPDWLVEEEGAHLPLRAIKIGREGLHKSINLGVRSADREIDYVAGFFAAARAIGPTS